MCAKRECSRKYPRGKCTKIGVTTKVNNSTLICSKGGAKKILKAASIKKVTRFVAWKMAGGQIGKPTLKQFFFTVLKQRRNLYYFFLEIYLQGDRKPVIFAAMLSRLLDTTYTKSTLG